jgi:hypothetical protein
MQYVTFKGQRFTTDDVLQAMRKFDAVRGQFRRWKTWGIRHSHKDYPPKELLRLTTGLSVEGGPQINNLFKRLGFDVVQVGDAIPQHRQSLPGPALQPDALDGLERYEPEYNSETNRDAIIKARIGQGRFRDDLISLWRGCAVTGCGEPAVLRASHIKPWRLSDNRERLDPFNCLLLIANLDALFDAGVVSFATTGKMLFSPRTATLDPALLGLNHDMELRKVDPRTLAYLAEHRRLHGYW